MKSIYGAAIQCSGVSFGSVTRSLSKHDSISDGTGSISSPNAVGESGVSNQRGYTVRAVGRRTCDELEQQEIVVVVD